ncbi:MAG: V-type ATP synthase subunit E [Lentisphaeria bacterium]|nr:V-type ATP synthase subunit E [Lentisphaeria bacterium]
MNDNETKLRQEILEDARRRGERLVQRATMDVDKALAALRTEIEAYRTERLAAARREAEAKTRALTAHQGHEIRRRWLQRREEVLDALFDACLAEVEEGRGMDPSRSLRECLVEALAGIGPRDTVVRVGPSCAGVLTDELLGAARLEAWGEGAPGALTRRVDEGLPPGVMVESADGGRLFDNTYRTRLARLRAPLRARVCAGIDVAEGGMGSDE